MISQSKIRRGATQIAENNPRDVRGDDYPWNAEIENQLKFLINYAALAPSTHNTQPWLFRVTDRTVDVFADRSRALPVIDPDDRALIISCGAAAGNLTTVLDAVGFDYKLTVFPDFGEQDLIARFQIVGRNGPAEDWVQVLTAVHDRRTVRAGYREKPIPVTLLQNTAKALSSGAANISVHCNAECEQQILDAVVEAEAIRTQDKHYVRENASWMHPMRKRSRDGVPFTPSKVKSNNELWSTPVQFLESGERQTLAGAVLTDRDSQLDWVNAGIALARMLNSVARTGIGAAVISHPLFLESTRVMVQESLDTEQIPQILVRFGYPERSPVTPRRPLVDVMLHPGFSR